MRVETIYIIKTKDNKSAALVEEKQGIELYTSGLFETSSETRAVIEGIKVKEVITRNYIHVDKIEIIHPKEFLF